MPDKFYITTAIDYPNAKPHLGHALEKLQADVLARFKRLEGRDVFFLTGTDEHGVKNVRAAEEADVPVDKFVDENVKYFKELVKSLNISNDYFIRTVDKKQHWPTVEVVWNTLLKNADLYKKQYKGLYCVGHEAFVTQKDLKDGICQDHGKAPEEIEEENYFFKLSKYSKQIKDAIESEKFSIVPKERENEILKLIEEGLQDVSFSRLRKDLSWGIPVPGDEEHTIYVWADALSNYISALGWGTDKDEKFRVYWPADAHVIGKDILRFHAAIWPAILLSLGIDLPKKLLVHGFISIEGQKMSKTLGNIVNPIDIIQKYGADALRWYLLAEIPTTRDGDFSRDKFEARYNGDLASGIGNFASRVTTLGEKHLEKPLKTKLKNESEKEINTRLENYKKSIEDFNFMEATKQVQALVSFGDKRVNDAELWKLVKEDKDKFTEEMADIATILAHVAWMLIPILPNTADKIFKQLGTDSNSKKDWEFKFQKSEPLFPRLK